MKSRINFFVLIFHITFVGGCNWLIKSDVSSQDDNRTLNVAWESQPRTIDPRFAVDANSQYLEDLIGCSLVVFDANGQPQPSLAKEMPIWIKPNLLQVNIREGIRFQDGTPVSAEDVKATYDFFLKKTPPLSPRAGAFNKVSAIRTISPHTLEFELMEPDASFMTNLVVGILPRVKAPGDEIKTPEDYVGCGPYTLRSIDMTGLSLTRNQTYNLGTAPLTENILIKVIKSEKTRFAKLRKGELDLVQNIINRDLVPLIERKYPQLAVQHAPGLKTTYLGFNMRDRLLQNHAVRSAIGMAIDRKVLIKYLMGGMAAPAAALLPAGNPFFNGMAPVTPFSVNDANILLDKAGFKADASGIRFSISYKTTTDVTRINIAKAIAAQLKKIGIHVNVEPMEWGRFKLDVEKGNVQLWSLTWIGFKDPDIYRYAFASESFPPNGGNRGWYSNPELDALLTRARQETAIESRLRLYHQAQDIVSRDLPYIFLWHEENFVVHQKNVRGFKLYADGRFSALTHTRK